MKRPIYFLTIVLFSTATLTTFGEITIPVNHSNGPGKQCKSDIQICIVYKKDGSSTRYTSLKLVTGIFTSPHLLADGKIKIMPDEIIAYQVGDMYVISQKELGDTNPSKVATDVLPGFAKRISTGNINVYVKQVYNGAKAIEVLVMKNGGEGLAEPFQYSAIQQVNPGQPGASNITGNRKKGNKSKKVEAVAEAYNSSLDISKN